MSVFENDSVPEDFLSHDDSGDDTQLRFHYQAQRIACLAISLISTEAEYARIYCELHDDALLKHWDRTYTAYQVKSKERSQPKFRATEKTILKSIRNFIRLQRFFSTRMRRFIIASNHPFTSDRDKNDVRFLIELAKSPSASGNALDEFIAIFKSKHEGYTESEVVEVLKKLDVQDQGPDFSAALSSVVQKLRSVPDLQGVDEQALLNCARALISKIENCSRKQVSGDENESGEINFSYKKASVNGKLLTASIVRNTLQAALGIPLGTAYRRIAIQTVPQDCIPIIKSAFASSGHSLMSTKRSLTDGTRFERIELNNFCSLRGAAQKNEIPALFGFMTCVRTCLPLAKHDHSLSQTSPTLKHVLATIPFVDQLPELIAKIPESRDAFVVSLVNGLQIEGTRLISVG
jgi:hypothetical protein